MFAKYTLPEPVGPATKIIATVTRDGRVHAIRLDNETAPSFGLEAPTEREFPLGTAVQPGQMVDTVVVAP